jgi:hypothetical protein
VEKLQCPRVPTVEARECYLRLDELQVHHCAGESSAHSMHAQLAGMGGGHCACSADMFWLTERKSALKLHGVQWNRVLEAAEPVHGNATWN